MDNASAVAAADGALKNTGASLFRPFRLERWLALGFVAFLDQCTQLVDSTAQAGVRIAVDNTPRPVLADLWGWLAARPLVATGLAALVLGVGIAIGALALWLTTRGRFMYLDNVATGRSDIARPWREHAGRASSHFAWALGVALGTFMAGLALVLPLIWAIVALARSGARPGPIAGLVVTGLALLVLATVSALFLLAMRDFVAPLQWFADVPCGPAIRILASLVRANPGLFVVYVLLKIVLAIVMGIAVLLVCCFTCCVGLIPVIQQTLLQPAYYFERRWSIELLAQLGYGPPAMPGAAPSGEPVITAALPPPPSPPPAPSTPPFEGEPPAF